MSALDDNPTVLMVRKHLVEFLGPPDEVFELSGSPVPDSPVQALNLAYFAPQGPEAPVVFATCGASLLQMPDGRRVEGMVLLRREPERPAFEAVHKLLAQFALFSESSGQPVSFGDMVRAPDMLQPFCAMDAVLFMPPVPFVPNFHRAPIGPEEHVEMVWLLPVYEAEAEYSMKHGPQALMMLFAAQSLDLTDPHRGEANTLVDPQDAEQMARRAMEEAKENPQAAAPVPSAGKPKTSRRDVNQGSYNVADAGNKLRITRRGGAKKPPPPAGPPPAAPQRAAPPRGAPPPEISEDTLPTAPAPAAPPRRGPPAGRRPARGGGRPVAVRPPSKKEEVRFDLGARGRPGPGAAPTAPARRAPPKAAPPPAKRAAPRPQTAEEKKAEKKKRVEALKTAAREAAQRAAKRQTGEATAAPPKAEPPPEAVQGDRSALRAAAKRRGGVGGTIREKLEDTEQ